MQIIFIPSHFIYASPNPATGDGGLMVVGGSTLNNLGTLVVLGDFTNNGNASLGTGTIKLMGSSSQAVGGTNTFQNLEVNNATGVTVNGPAQVNGTLTLTNGLITLGGNTMQLGTSATVAGTPGPTKMVVATGAGQMRKQFSGNGSFTFPVGDNTGNAEYSPVTLNFTAGTYGSGNWAGVNLVNAAYTGSVTSYLNRYWNVSSNGITGFACNAQFNYNSPADIVGTESDIYCVKADPFVMYDNANTVSHQLTASALTSFGTFTGQLGIRKLNLSSVFLEGLYTGSSTMMEAADVSYDEYGNITGVFPKWGTGVADHISVELHASTTHYDSDCDCQVSDYPTIAYPAIDIPLSTTGTAAVNIPASKNGLYYLTIKQRNSVETTSALPVSFSGSTITYAFDAFSQAYDGNMTTVLESDGETVSPPLIFGGDVNQDQQVEAEDMNAVANAAAIFTYGYVPPDVYGDGQVEGADLNITANNAASFVYAHFPM